MEPSSFSFTVDLTFGGSQSLIFCVFFFGSIIWYVLNVLFKLVQCGLCCARAPNCRITEMIICLSLCLPIFCFLSFCFFFVMAQRVCFKFMWIFTWTEKEVDITHPVARVHIYTGAENAMKKSEKNDDDVLENGNNNNNLCVCVCRFFFFLCRLWLRKQSGYARAIAPQLQCSNALHLKVLLRLSVYLPVWLAGWLLGQCIRPIRTFRISTQSTRTVLRTRFLLQHLMFESTKEQSI